VANSVIFIEITLRMIFSQMKVPDLNNSKCSFIKHSLTVKAFNFLLQNFPPQSQFKIRLKVMMCNIKKKLV